MKVVDADNKTFGLAMIILLLGMVLSRCPSRLRSVQDGSKCEREPGKQRVQVMSGSYQAGKKLVKPVTQHGLVLCQTCTMP